ncbi:MAG: hypothetical protein ACIAQU_04375 [Phycisphaerales bacterium JB064]
MRKLTDCDVEGKCANLDVYVHDEPGQGGACHLYSIGGYDTSTNPSSDAVEFRSPPIDRTGTSILFQNGPIDEDGNGANGIQIENLLAIVQDRLRGFQSGKYACDANQIALDHTTAALEALKARTRERLGRGVEGTHTV